MFNKKLISLILVFVAISFVSAESAGIEDKILDSFMDKPIEDLYETWKFVYNKQTVRFHALQDTIRFRNFEKNVQEIKAHNARTDSTYKMGLNNFSDMSWEEFSDYYNLNHEFTDEEIKKFLAPTELFVNDSQSELESKALTDTPPQPRDWTKHMMPVRDQEHCGSCWAFATLGTIEGKWNKDKSTADTPIVLKEALSTQYSLDCTTGTLGCKGASLSRSFYFYHDNRPIWDSSYQYTAVQGDCKKPADKDMVNITLKRYNGGSNPDMHRWLAQGPLGIQVGVDRNWMAYKSGIFDKKCTKGPNHAVVLVGYGVENGVPYWLIKNSWGTVYGEKGYIRVKDDQSNNKSCQITSLCYNPILY